MKVAAYVMALEDQPGWAIEKTVRRFIMGDVGDKVFAPTPPQLREAVSNTVWAAKGRAAWLRSLAKMPVAKTTTAEERAATLARLADIIKPKKENA